MKRILLSTLLVSALTGCDEQRDLYDVADAVMHVEGSWGPSLNQPSMMDATVMLHTEDGVTHKPLSHPNTWKSNVKEGQYDVMIFNGVMASEQETNLDHVFFRGTDRLETFEVYAAEGRANSRLTRAEGEYIASNEMEIFTFAHTRVAVGDDPYYYIKYQDGEKYPEVENGRVTRVDMTPRAMSYRFRVRINNLANPRSARSASAAIRGFLGSVFVPAEGGMPRAGFDATHHVTLSAPSGRNTRTDGDGTELGVLVSQTFVTFGPPMDEESGGRRYLFDPVFVLTDGSEFRFDEPFDITEKVEEAILRLRDHHRGDHVTDITLDENLFEIEIDGGIALPAVVPDGGGADISVDPWEDDEVVLIWVGRN